MSKISNNTFYVTTAIDYASGKPHLGHAYEKTAADVLARWNRNIGKDTYFQTGTDEHGQKIVREATKINKKPSEFVKFITPQFKNLCKDLNINYDYFIQTTNEDHKKFVQKMLQKSFDNGDIYLKKYTGLYCVGCEQYYLEKDSDNGHCPIHKTKLDKIEEENYFFKLSKYEKDLLKLYEENPLFISPKAKLKEMKNRIKEGLEDVSISRKKETLDWGIEFPFDKNHVAYVWFDALFSYMSGLKTNKKENHWPANVHIVGHDIMWFHTVYWPTFLMSVGEKVPHKIFAHGMILDETGHKMSKSLGNVIEPLKQVKKFGLDEFRFYLLSMGSFGEDLKYSEKLFVEKINNDLNNDLGNLVSRVHAMTTKYFGESVPSENTLSKNEIELISKLNIFKKFNEEIQNLEFNKAIDTLWNIIRETNAYINKVEPWKQNDIKVLENIISTLIFSVKTITNYVDCFMPQKAEMIRKQFNFKKEDFSKFENVKAGHKIGKKENIFQKFKIEEKKQIIVKKKGFAALNLKVGKIISIENHPEAEKLFVEKIDIGEKEPRQIVSGLKDHYKAKDLLGKKVIVVANLKKAKLRGVESQGMILAAEDDKNVGVITTDAEVGTNLSCGDEKADNDSQIKTDKFFQVKIKSEGNKIIFNKKEVTVKKKKLFADKNIKGEIK